MNLKLNHLLAALSPEAQHRIFGHLELIQQNLGDVLYESGDTLRNVYFPLNSIVSLLNVIDKDDAQCQRTQSMENRQAAMQERMQMMEHQSAEANQQ